MSTFLLSGFAEHVIFDTMEGLSANAQALKQIITNSIIFLNSNQRIYIKVKENRVLGFIKVGERNLFYRDFVLVISM